MKKVEEVFYDLPDEKIQNYGWLVNGSPLASSHISKCGIYDLVGGHEIFGYSSELKRKYTNLFPHSHILIIFNFMKIGKWTDNHFFLTDNTGNKIIDVSFNANNDSPHYELCGSALNPEALRQYKHFIKHNTSSLELTFNASLSEDSSISSWGIFNFSLYIASCHDTCEACTEYNDPSKCTKCPSGLYLQNISADSSACLSTCPDGTYKNSENGENICSLCSVLCLTCSGPRGYDCLSCKNGTFLQLLAGPSSCGTSCNTHYFGDNTDNICKECAESCLSCVETGKNGCSACPADKFLQAKEGPAACSDECPAATYKYPLNQTCLGCSINCFNCSNASDNDCTSCKYGKILVTEVNSSKCVDFFNITPKNLSFYVIEKNNPTVFEIAFSDEWEYIEKNFNNLFMFNIGPSDVKVSFFSIFSSSYTQNAYVLNLKYNKNFTADKYKMTITIQINYSNSNYAYFLYNNSVTLDLKEYRNISDDEYFNTSNF